MSETPTKHMRELCEKLGSQYCIKDIDDEKVIYRDFGNGFDIEISGANTASSRKTVTIYLWKNKRIIVKTLENVQQYNIGDRVEELYYESIEL